MEKMLDEFNQRFEQFRELDVGRNKLMEASLTKS